MLVIVCTKFNNRIHTCILSCVHFLNHFLNSITQDVFFVLLDKIINDRERTCLLFLKNLDKLSY